MEPGKPAILNKKYAFLLRKLLSAEVPQVTISSISNFPEQPLFIDAREDSEYKISTIAGAIKGGSKNFESNLPDHTPKERWIVVFCSVGLRSEKVCKKLMTAGYTNVYNLYGGIFEWVNQGFQVVNCNGQCTDTIHGFSPLWAVWVKGVKKVYGKKI